MVSISLSPHPEEPRSGVSKDAPDRSTILLAHIERKTPILFGPQSAMQKQDGCWLYIVKCNDGSLYTGTTRGEVESRVAQHNAGLYPNGYTSTRRPVSLVFAEHFPSILDAIAMERRVKGWSRRKKQAMIDGRWEELPELARRRT